MPFYPARPSSAWHRKHDDAGVLICRGCYVWSCPHEQGRPGVLKVAGSYLRTVQCEKCGTIWMLYRDQVRRVVKAKAITVGPVGYRKGSKGAL